MKPQRDKLSVFWHVDEILATVRAGLSQMDEADGGKQAAGLLNVIVYGRALTQALQTLRSIEPRFDDWYKPWQSKLAADPIARRFLAMRSEILKEGKLATYGTANIVDYRALADLAITGAPPRADEFFMGDNFGRVGWQVPSSDGIIEKHFVILPPSIGTTSLTIAGLPPELRGLTAREVAGRYVDLLASIVVDAISKLKQ